MFLADNVLYDLKKATELAMPTAAQPTLASVARPVLSTATDAASKNALAAKANIAAAIVVYKNKREYFAAISG